jgi:hypothetical protein
VHETHSRNRKTGTARKHLLTIFLSYHRNRHPARQAVKTGPIAALPSA